MTLGGGSWMQKVSSFDLLAPALKAPAFSHAAKIRASAVLASNVLSIAMMKTPAFLVRREVACRGGKGKGLADEGQGRLALQRLPDGGEVEGGD